MALHHPDYIPLLEALDMFGREMVEPLLASGQIRICFIDEGQPITAAVRSGQLARSSKGAVMVKTGQVDGRNVFLERKALSSAQRDLGKNIINLAVSTIAAENRCSAWLEEAMRKSPLMNPKPKRQWEIEAIGDFQVSKRAFDRAWGKAVAASGAVAWSEAGAKPKR